MATTQPDYQSCAKIIIDWNEFVHFLVQMAQIYILDNSISYHFSFPESLTGREVKVDIDCDNGEHSQNGKADEF